MAAKFTRRRKPSSSENIDMIQKYNLWMLKAEESEHLAGSPNSDELRRQRDLFEMLKTKSLDPTWISSNECLKREYKADDFYILPVFKGKVFKHLTSLKCRIYGPLALITCIKRNERLPKRHSPIWSTNLRGAVVCFSGIEIETRKQQMSLVKVMGGTISKAFTEKVTHLVADSQDTKSRKFVTAIDYSVPVMSVSWIFAAWKAAKAFSESNFIADQFVGVHKLPIFARCVISCSGVAPHDRPALSQLIEANGGHYTGNMRKNECTHLVTDLNSGDKYRMARNWGWNRINIVRTRWLTKSVEKGYRLPERLYETMNSVECGTPRSSQLSQLYTPPSSTGQQRTVGPSSDAELSSGSISQSRLTKTVTSEIDETVFSGSSSLKIVLSQEDEMKDDPVGQLDCDSLQLSHCMPNCIVYFCGITDENIKKYKCIINKLGTGCQDELHPSVTHVIVGPEKLAWKLIEQLKEKARNNVKIVACNWIIDCAKAQKFLDETHYLLLKLKKSVYDCSQLTHGHKKSKLKITQLGIKILGKIFKFSSSRDIPNENIGERSMSICSEESSGDSHLFSGLSFRINVVDDELLDKLRSDIQSRGGKVEYEQNIRVNYMVCAVLDYHLNDEERNYNCGNIVSSYWLQDCIEKGAVLNTEKHPLYRPIGAHEDSKIFKGCFIALSALPATERNVFTDILNKFGAEVKNCLGRNGGDKQVDFNTHMITGAETDRTELARQLKIPVLDPSWIIESIIQNRLQSIDSYLFRDQPFKNYARKDRLWLISSEQKSIGDNSDSPYEEINISNEQSMQGISKDDLRKATPKLCLTNLIENKSTEDSKITKAARSQNLENNQFVECERNMDTQRRVQKEPEVRKSLVDLDLREAYAYVDEMNTQNTSISTRSNETWTDSVIENILSKAVVKTAKPSEVPWSPSVTEANGFSRVQSRQNKRKLELLAPNVVDERSKKSKTDISQKQDEERNLKEEKKRKIADRLAALALQREEHARALEAEKEKQREDEKKTMSRRPKKVVSPRRPSKKRCYEPPHQECIGWEESKPRPIATQIINPFDSDSEEVMASTPVATVDEQQMENQPCTSKDTKYLSLSEESPIVPRRKICFTWTEGHDRDALMAMVLELGGEICNEFDDTVTHLVCGRVVRNEKLLCSIAKGLVIVDVDYIIDSHKQTKWLEIDDYEWGNSRSTEKHSFLTQRFVPFALACHRWRVKIEKNPTQRAFQSWKVLFYCGRHRFNDLRQIIHFGGGEAQLRDDVTSLQGFTIALVEKSRYWNSREVMRLIDNNIQCFNIDYLATYLTLDEECLVENYFHKDYASALSRLSRH